MAKRGKGVVKKDLEERVDNLERVVAAMQWKIDEIVRKKNEQRSDTMGSKR